MKIVVEPYKEVADKKLADLREEVEYRRPEKAEMRIRTGE